MSTNKKYMNKGIITSPAGITYSEPTTEQYGSKWVAETNITSPMKCEFSIGGNTKEEALERLDDFVNNKPLSLTREDHMQIDYK